MQIRTILVTTDFSATSERAFAPALEMAARFDAQLIVLYVEDDRATSMFVEYMAVGPETLQAQQAERARERLAEFVSRLCPGDSSSVEREIAVGVPHVEILRMARERGAELIVMATHGRGLISHALMGSTTERVLRRAPCPVLVVQRESSGEGETPAR